MARLVMNSQARTAPMELKPGLNSIGRAGSNDFAIEDSSVSSAHCQIMVEGDEVSIRDLGSTNGTFVDGQLITEACIHPGQMLRLGTVELRLEAEPAPAAACKPLERIEPDKPVFCKNHYQNHARYQCPKCRRFLCDLCVHTRGSADGGLKFCKICGIECAQVALRPVLKTVDFFPAARQAFRYPFLGDGWALLIGGTLFFGLLDLANYVARNAFTYGMRAMMMRVVIFTFIFGTGYLFSFLKNIIACTAQGDDRMPDWPELTQWKEDIVSPMFQFLVLCVTCFGPALAAYLAMDWWFDVDYPWLVWLIALAGCVYFPMAFLGVAILDTLGAVHPLFVVGSILRVPREYAIAVLVFGGLLAFRWLSETILQTLLKIPVVPVLTSDLLSIGLLMVEARILGLLYLAHKDDLRWFKR
jgi:hypothetical protein